MLRDLYPFSTVDGVPIPLDIIRPLGVLRISIPINTGSDLLALGVVTPILVLRSTVNCFVRFGTIATIPSTTMIGDSVYIPANETLVVAPGLTDISVIGENLVGVLDVQLLEQWAGLGKELPYRR